MSTVRIISDLHFNHKNLIIGLRKFSSIEEHNNLIINNWNSVVTKKDTTYILGDLFMETKKGYEILNKLNGRKIVIAGNHDIINHSKELLKYVEAIGGMVKYKGYVLSHCPIHPSQLKRYRKNIHGHLHRKLIYKGWWIFKRPDKRYINVSAELLDYMPKTLKELGL